jgi:hypothetical protein
VGATGWSGLTKGEIEILIDGLADDVSFLWALIHLGICESPSTLLDEPPSAAAIAAAFESFERLVTAGLARLGRIEYVDPTQPAGTVAPVRHVEEPIAAVRMRVEQVVREAGDWSDWAFCCWLVNTEAGDATARLALERNA